MKYILMIAAIFIVGISYGQKTIHIGSTTATLMSQSDISNLVNDSLKVTPYITSKVATADSTAGPGHYSSNYDMVTGLALKAPQTAVDSLPGDNELTNKLALKVAVADSGAGVGHYTSNYDFTTEQALDVKVADSTAGIGHYMSNYDGVTGLAAKVDIADSTAGIGHYASNYDMVTGLATKATPQQISDSISNMKSGIFNVLDYGATPNDGINDNTAIQAAIDAAGNGKVIIPSGYYYVDSLIITKSPTIEGVGWDWQGNSSMLRSVTSKPIISIDYKVSGGAGYATGAILRNLYIKGDNSADSSTIHKQTGIVVNGEAGVQLDNVYIANCGDYGLRLASNYHTDLVNIDGCRFEDNTKGGIYGHSRTGILINAIRILNTTITDNGYGINIWGSNIIIRYNIIQGNDSSGVFLSGRDMTPNSVSAYNVVISDNYMEENGGGNICAETYWQSGDVNYIYSLRIQDNYMYLSDATAVPTATGSIILKRATGSAATVGIYTSVIGPNEVTVDGTLYNIIATSGIFNAGDIVNVTNTSQTEALYYSNISGARIQGRKKADPFVTTGTITAGTGITEAMLSECMYFNTASAIDISSNPQIVDGWDGQVITIVGSSDTNTLTLDDGNGLSISSQFVMGIGDAITLRYNITLDLWVEVSRSNN